MLEGDARGGLLTSDSPDFDKAWSELKCRILVPAEFLSIFLKDGLLQTVMDDLRRFPRYHYHVRAVLHYRQTLPAVPRGEESYLVLTKDLSRSGLCFLHEQQLFPGERMALDLAGGKHMPIEVTRCTKHNDRCFEIGADFLKHPSGTDRIQAGSTS